MSTELTLSQSKSTIIIAAYNEASIIRATIRSLVENTELNHYQILVICNGCSDNTEDIIRNEFHTVFCYSIPQASKSLAIRYAESLAPGFPRLYLDADIELNAGDAIALIDFAKKQSAAALIVPASKLDTEQSQNTVKRFYRVWYDTPYVQQLGFGAGAYLLNQLGRDRFTDWPELIADDGFIRSQFLKHEIHVLEQYKVKVKAPKDIFSLIKVKARSKRGNIELKRYLDQHNSFRKESKRTTLKHTLQVRSSLCDRLVYLFVNLTALTLAKWQSLIGFKAWPRDNSNR